MLKLILLSYVGLASLAAIFQRRLLYFPTRLSREQAEQAAALEGLTPWTNAAGQLIGWTIPTRDSVTASVLLVHGNGGYAVDRGYLAKAIHSAASVNVFILEYPGYGARNGSPTMASLLGAADEAYAMLDTAKAIYVVSESLGTGVAAHLAQANPRIAGMSMFVPFDDLAAVAQSVWRFLPVYLILRDRYEPAKWLQQYRGPVKFVVAEADREIPARFGQRLHDSYPGPKELQVLANAGHQDTTEQSVEWWRDLFLFWQRGGA